VRASRIAAAECQVHGKGVVLVPSVALGREREARHFLIVGSVGGGKTQTMLHLIEEVLSAAMASWCWTPRAT
jgi:hypothetical protein